MLFIFGILILISSSDSLKLGSTSGEGIPDYFNSFVTAFLLTFSSPLTIVFWTGLFAAKAIEKNYTKNELFVFGISAGLATFLFLGSSVILFSFFKTSIPPSLIIWLNKLVGILLIPYGAFRGVKLMSWHI